MESRVHDVLSQAHCIRDLYIFPLELNGSFSCILAFYTIDCVEFHELCQTLTISLIALAAQWNSHIPRISSKN